jgi:cytochrome c-type protein NapB
MKAALWCGLAAGIIALISVKSPGADRAARPIEKSPAEVRAARRAYDGAPPVVPHQPFGISCPSCHNMEGMAVSGVGYAPPSPHAATMGMSAISRCQQCHVFATTTAVFVDNTFQPLDQDLRQGERLYPLAPPTMPHSVFMRENCVACHTGPAARNAIRTSHPERLACRQCHVPVLTRSTFAREP